MALLSVSFRTPHAPPRAPARTRALTAASLGRRDRLSRRRALSKAADMGPAGERRRQTSSRQARPRCDRRASVAGRSAGGLARWSCLRGCCPHGCEGAARFGLMRRAAMLRASCPLTHGPKPGREHGRPLSCGNGGAAKKIRPAGDSTRRGDAADLATALRRRKSRERHPPAQEAVNARFSQPQAPSPGPSTARGAPRALPNCARPRT